MDLTGGVLLVMSPCLDLINHKHGNAILTQSVRTNIILILTLTLTITVTITITLTLTLALTRPLTLILNLSLTPNTDPNTNPNTHFKEDQRSVIIKASQDYKKGEQAP